MNVLVIEYLIVHHYNGSFYLTQFSYEYVGQHHQYLPKTKKKYNHLQNLTMIVNNIVQMIANTSRWQAKNN